MPDVRKKLKLKAQLNWPVGGADEIAQHSYIGTVSADAPSVHRKAEFFSLLQINTCVVQFGQTKTLRGQNTVETVRVNGTRRTMAAPRASSYLVELLPIAFLPGRHAALLCQVFSWDNYLSNPNLSP